MTGRALVVGAAIALLLAGYGLVVGQSDAEPVRAFAFVDFYDYYYAAEAVREGDDPYDAALGHARAVAAALPAIPGSDYIYPPWFAVVLAPLTGIAPRPASALFFAFSAATLLAFLAWTWWQTRSLTAVLLALTFAPVLFTLFVGQINLLLLGLMAAAWQLRVRRPALAGVALGFATALKLSPVLLVLAVLQARRWRMLAAVGATLLVCLVAGEVAVPGSTGHYVTEVLPEAGNLDARLAHPVNQGLGGFLLRLLAANRWTQPWVDAPILASLLTVALSLATLGAIGFLVFRSRPGRPFEEWRAWAAATVAMTVLSPLAWEATYCFVLLSAVLLRVHARSSWSLVAVWIGFVVQRAIDDFANYPDDHPFLRNFPLLASPAFLAVAALLVWIVAARNSEPPAPAAPRPVS